MSDETDEEIMYLNDRIDTLNFQIDELVSDNADLRQRIDDLETQLEEAKEELHWHGEW